MTQSRRELLSLAVAAVAGEAAAAEPPESLNRQYVSRYELTLVTRGTGFRAKLSTTGGRTYEVDVAFPDSAESFIKMVDMALAGKGRLALEIENDNRTVRSFRFEAP